MTLRTVTRPNRIWPATRYVDFDTGNDSNDGASPYTPWKRAPGDPAAVSGGPSTYTPAAGAIIQFKGGVVYRGRIDAKASGTIAQPIVYRGTGWGAGKAIIDGADRHVCAASSCAGDMSVPAVVRSDQFLVVTMPGGIAPQAWRPIKMDGEYLEWSQYPLPPNFWDWTRTDVWLRDLSSVRTKGVVDQGGGYYAGTLQSSEITTALAGDPGYDLSFKSYGYASAIYTPESCTYDQPTNTLTAFRMLGVSNDIGRPGEEGDPFVLCNHPRFLVQTGARPGMFCSIDSGTRIIVRRAVSTPFSGNVVIEPSVRNLGFDFKTHSDVQLVGFEIRNQGGPIATISSAVTRSTGAAERQDVSDCYIHHIAGSNGSATGVIARGLVQRVDVEDTWEGRGVTAPRLMDSTFKNLGYSCVSYSAYLGYATFVDRVTVYDMQHVHGNSMAFYSQDDGATATNVTIFASARPLTVQGGTGMVTLRRSVLSGGDPAGLVGYPNNFPYFVQSQGGFINWQNNSGGITIESSVLLSVNGTDGTYINQTTGVTFTGNVVQGVTLAGGGSLGTFSNNLFVSSTGYSAPTGNTLDATKLTAARAFASFTPTYDAGLVTVLRNGNSDPDFYVGAPDWSLVQAPVRATDPVITGATTVGSTLTVTPGTCVQNRYNSRDYQWFINGVGQTTAQGLTFVIPAGAAGRSITCRERHHNRVGTLVLTTAAVVTT